MPEGHSIHRIARRHRAELAGHEIAVSSPQRRFAAEPATIDGQRLDEVEAYGKHLFHRFGRWVVHVHLGQQGRFLWFPSPAPDPRPQVRLRLAAETGAADLIAPSICPLGPLQLRDAVVASLGPDPLHEDADVDLVRRRFARDRRPIGAVLLDQSVLAGVGNVIRTEALFLEGLDPWIPAAALDRARFDRLWATLTGIMERSAVDAASSRRTASAATPASSTSARRAGAAAPPSNARSSAAVGWTGAPRSSPRGPRRPQRPSCLATRTRARSPSGHLIERVGSPFELNRGTAAQPSRNVGVRARHGCAQAASR
jgi:endonuclease-8